MNERKADLHSGAALSAEFSADAEAGRRLKANDGRKQNKKARSARSHFRSSLHEVLLGARG